MGVTGRTLASIATQQLSLFSFCTGSKGQKQTHRVVCDKPRADDPSSLPAVAVSAMRLIASLLQTSRLAVLLFYVVIHPNIPFLRQTRR